MDQKRYAKHLAKKKASHSRRLGRYQQQLAALPHKAPPVTAAEAPDLCLCGASMVGPGQGSAPDCVCNVATSEAPE